MSKAKTRQGGVGLRDAASPLLFKSDVTTRNVPPAFGVRRRPLPTLSDRVDPTAKPTAVLSPITPEIEQICALLTEAVSFALSATSSARVMRHWESETEGGIAHFMVARQIEAVVVLAREDLALVASAATLSRAAFETAVRALWMLAPEEPFNREARWLAFVKEVVGYHEAMADECQKIGEPIAARRHLDERAGVEQFRANVDGVLPVGTLRPGGRRGVPTLHEMLRSLNQARLYVAYRELSQYTHGTSVAGGLYRQGLGTGKTFGEFVRVEHWRPCLELCWSALSNLTLALLRRLNVHEKHFVRRSFVDRMRAALEAVPAMSGRVQIIWEPSNEM